MTAESNEPEDLEDAEEEAAEEPQPIPWDIRRQGRAWTPEEFRTRVDRLLGVEIEVSRGRLFGSEETRRLVLGMLLENMGIEAVVKMGDARDWKEAIDALLTDKA